MSSVARVDWAWKYERAEHLQHRWLRQFNEWSIKSFIEVEPDEVFLIEINWLIGCLLTKLLPSSHSRLLFVKSLLLMLFLAKPKGESRK